MFRYEEILSKNPMGVMATRAGEEINTRVFQFLFSEGNKAYFCTEADKKVYRQMVENENVSFCSFPADFSITISIVGKVCFVGDIELKERVLREKPLIKEIFKTADNPKFKLFYIKVKQVETFTMEEGSKIYVLEEIV